jgi:hypothetical protein
MQAVTVRQHDDAAAPRIVCSRRNFAVAEIIDKGIALQEKCGTGAAAAFLRRKMVNIEVTARVLLRQSARRRYANDADDGRER